MVEVGVFSASEPQPVEFSRFFVCLKGIVLRQFFQQLWGFQRHLEVPTTVGRRRLWLEVVDGKTGPSNEWIFFSLLGGQERFKIL